MKMLNKNRLNGFLFMSTLLFFLLGGVFLLLAIGADAVNPRADFWRLVRDGISGYTAVSSEGHSVLIHNGGENWREIRNLLIINITPWLMGGVLAVIVIFHLIVGGDKLEEPRTGIMIKRYSLAERLLHWYTAILFIILAITGLSILLGRAGLIPLVGHAAFSTYLSAAKIVHNVSGPFFLVGLLIEVVIWFRDNLIRMLDLRWFKNLGGMVGSSPRPHSGKVNGGEKAWFWLMTIFGAGVGVTGLLLDFPLWEQTRFTMQLSLAIHAIVGVLFVTASFGHIYMGTLGSEGGFVGMWRGRVDAAWAKQHADLWYKEVAEKDERLE
ncbi:MAG: formate dehydrogenase subunit gamma [Desulforhopalus sp.]